MELTLGAAFIAICVWIAEQLMAHTDIQKPYRLVILCVVVILSFLIYNQGLVL